MHVERYGTLLERASEFDLATRLFYLRHRLAGSAWDSSLPDTEAIDTALSLVHEKARVRALDLGAGTGRNTHYLLERGCQVMAIDRSKRDLETLLRSLPDGMQTNVRALAMPASRLDGLEAFEVDFVLDVLGPFSDLSDAKFSRYVRAVRARMAAGGVWLIATSERSRVDRLQGDVQVDMRALEHLSRPPLTWAIVRSKGQGLQDNASQTANRASWSAGIARSTS